MRTGTLLLLPFSTAILCLVLLVTPAAATWVTNGVAVCTVGQNQYNPRLTSDGAGGVILVWYDNRPGTYADIYAQRLDASGTPQWAAQGTPVCTAAYQQTYGVALADGSGGAFIAWNDYRSGSEFDIYAQRLNASGAPLWTADGVAVCTAANHQDMPVLVSDGAGGVILAWEDGRYGNYDIFAQRLNASGVAQWTGGGIGVCTSIRAGPG